MVYLTKIGINLKYGDSVKSSPLFSNVFYYNVGGCIQMFPDWPPGAKTENGTALYH